MEDKDYRLLVFYDTNCGHCEEMFSELNKWYTIPENEVWFDIVSVGLDDEQETWKEGLAERLFPWTDLYAPEGVNSEVASNYYVLSTPSMFVIDKKGELAAVPGSVHELDRFLNGE